MCSCFVYQSYYQSFSFRSSWGSACFNVFSFFFSFSFFLSFFLFLSFFFILSFFHSFSFFFFYFYSGKLKWWKQNKNKNKNKTFDSGIVRFFKGPKAKRSIKTSLNFLLLQCILTFFGIYTQVKSGLTLPFWIKLILGPALILEFFLTFFISLTSPSYAGHPDVGSGFHHHELEPEM